MNHPLDEGYKNRWEPIPENRSTAASLNDGLQFKYHREIQNNSRKPINEETSNLLTEDHKKNGWEPIHENRSNETSIDPDMQWKQYIEVKNNTQKSIIQEANILQRSLVTTLELLVQRIYILEKNNKFENVKDIEQNLNQSTVQAIVYNCLEEIRRVNNYIKDQLNLYQDECYQVLKQSQYDDKVQIMDQHKDLTQIGFDYIQQYRHDNLITTASISPNYKIIATCCKNQIKIHTTYANILFKILDVSEPYTSIAYYENSTACILGSDSGQILIVNLRGNKIGEIMNQFQPHQNTICQIISIKQDQQIITLSKDNTIKITKLDSLLNILTINIVCNYFAGFDYSAQYQFIIAPNDKQIGFWDTQSGNSIMKLENVIDQETFIQVVLNTKQNMALINLFEEKKLLIIEINYSQKLVSIKYLIECKLNNLNVSWCLEDKAYFIMTARRMNVRYLEQANIQLIQRAGCYCTMPFLHKQNAQVINLLSIDEKGAYLYFVDKSLVDKARIAIVNER